MFRLLGLGGGPFRRGSAAPRRKPRRIWERERGDTHFRGTEDAAAAAVPSHYDREDGAGRALAWLRGDGLVLERIEGYSRFGDGCHACLRKEVAERTAALEHARDPRVPEKHVRHVSGGGLEVIND